MRTHVSDPVFYLFSDEPDWARDNLSLSGEVRVIDQHLGRPSTEVLRLMSSCRHNIIANSTYSWWAAWLNPNADRVVVAPRRWVADPACDCRDVLPAGWLAL